MTKTFQVVLPCFFLFHLLTTVVHASVYSLHILTSEARETKEHLLQHWAPRLVCFPSPWQRTAPFLRFNVVLIGRTPCWGTKGWEKVIATSLDVSRRKMYSCGTESLWRNLFHRLKRPKVLLLDTQRMSNTGQRRDPAHYDNEMFLVDAFSIIRCVGENQGRAEQ